MIRFGRTIEKIILYEVWWNEFLADSRFGSFSQQLTVGLQKVVVEKGSTTDLICRAISIIEIFLNEWFVRLEGSPGCLPGLFVWIIFAMSGLLLDCMGKFPIFPRQKHTGDFLAFTVAS